MSWFPVDDAFHSHPKARKAGMEAVGLWTLAGSHCMAYLTDGFVADWWVKEKPKGALLAKRLVAAGLWHRSEKDSEQGYQFHDWKPECLKVNVLVAREKARQRKAKQRESQRESRVTDSVSPASCLVPTQPNPTQPITSVVDLGGELTQVAPSPFCPQHPTGSSGRPCGACADARRGRENWDNQHQQHELARRRAHKAAVDACLLCDDRRLYQLHDDSLTRCNHQAAAHA